jgi:hypothetical protein
MKRSLTAILAFASAAGLAGMVQAQTMATPTATPSQNPQATAPSGQYGSYNNQYQSGTAPNYRSAQTTVPRTGMQQPATARQAYAGDFWSRNLSRNHVRQAQEELRAQGLYRGEIDGIVGPKTKEAVAQFQQENGLQQTATLDQQTVQRLSGGTAPSVGIGASTAPSGATAPLGAGGESYNTQQSLGRQNIQGQPNGHRQPMTR